jgi:hypothetical protein
MTDATATMVLDHPALTSSTLPADPPARTPRTHVDSTPLPTDSMVTVPLSESGGNTAGDDDDDDNNNNNDDDDNDNEQEAEDTEDKGKEIEKEEHGEDQAKNKDGQDSVLHPEIIVQDQRLSSRPTSSEIHKAFGRRDSQASILLPTLPSPTVSVHHVDADPDTPTSPTRSRRSSGDSGKSAHVDWAELERKETQQSNQQPSGEGQDNVRTPAPVPLPAPPAD